MSKYYMSTKLTQSQAAEFGFSVAQLVATFVGAPLDDAAKARLAKANAKLHDSPEVKAHEAKLHDAKKADEAKIKAEHEAKVKAEHDHHHHHKHEG